MSGDRLRDDLNVLAHRGSDVRSFSTRVARIVGRTVPFDGLCVLTMDPATLLPTGDVVLNGLPKRASLRVAEIEFRDRDVNSFETLARSGRFAATLSGATGGQLHRSKRHREVRALHGFGDELRAVLVGDTAVWGALTLLRRADREPFSAADAQRIGSVSPLLAEGLRRAMLLDALPGTNTWDADAAGLALLAPDNTITLADVAAERWLAELGGDGLSSVVAAVASRARSIAEGRATDGVVARARAQTASGTWLVVRASALGDEQIAVTLEPARPHEMAPLIADAYELTERERAVTELVAQGLATDAIGRRLHISPWTVQDHLKAVFEKVGVSTRGELVARLFFDHYAPRLSDGAPVSWSGWFAASAATAG